LQTALQQVVDEGVDRVVARHQATAHATREAAKALGLDLWPAREEIASPCCTAVAIPEGISDADLRATMRNRYGVMISGGFGSLAGKLFRLGHMGPSAHPTAALAQIGVLERSLLDLGHGITPGAGVGAMVNAFAGWDDASGTYPLGN